MQKNGGALRTPTQNENTPFFSAFFNPSSSNLDSAIAAQSPENNNHGQSPKALQKGRDADRSSDGRKPSFNRKTSFGSPKTSRSSKRRASSSVSAATAVTTATGGGGSSKGGKTKTVKHRPSFPPDFSLITEYSRAPTRAGGDDKALQSPASVDSFSKMLARTASNTVAGSLASSAPLSASMQPSETSIIHQHIQEMATKRISTLDYLRKAHEGRIYWFNTLLFDKPDIAKMPYFESRRLTRRATNYLLLGLSIPAVIDLNSSNPSEFLRSLNTLLSEFDTFTQLHPETGSAQQSSLSRAARLPQMFRRAATRRTSSSTTTELDQVPSDDIDFGPVSSAQQGIHTSSSSGSMISFAHSEHNADLLPGEEYTHLLTPSLPFDPDFFETFVTLCDVLIDCYTRMLSLVAAPSTCTGAVGELFGKADGRVRKILIQGVVKEFEDSSRGGMKTEVASVGKVVLGGLM